VKLPSGSTVDIPVITQITFLDVVDQAQESEFHLENGASANRDVHVASIPGNGDATDESGRGGSEALQVERVDIWRVLDVVERGQETFFHPDSRTVAEPPSAPPYFTTHEKTHVVKYINTPDDGNWIKSELIDRWKFGDTVEQGQETEYFLFNPPDNAGIAGLTLGTDSDGAPTVAIDPGVAEIADAIDPVRTDPWQNIIDFKGKSKSTISATIMLIIGGGETDFILLQGLVHGPIVQAPFFDIATYGALSCFSQIKAFSVIIDEKNVHHFNEWFADTSSLPDHMLWYTDNIGSQRLVSGTVSGFSLTGHLSYGILGEVIEVESPHPGGGAIDRFTCAPVAGGGSASTTVTAPASITVDIGAGKTATLNPYSVQSVAPDNLSMTVLYTENGWPPA
jgi:hypothetical protein